MDYATPGDTYFAELQAGEIGPKLEAKWSEWHRRPSQAR